MSDITTIHITYPLSSGKIMELMDEFPNLEKITCSKSLYERIPKNYLNALNELDIEVSIDYNQGPKEKFKDLENEIINLKKEDLTAKEISLKLNIPLKRVYYLLSKNSEDLKFNDYKKKYDDSKKSEIKSLKDEGKSVKEISLKLGIPLRTIYFILNEK